MVYPKRGWEPPPVPSGYKRKSDNLRQVHAQAAQAPETLRISLDTKTKPLNDSLSRK